MVLSYALTSRPRSFSLCSTFVATGLKTSNSLGYFLHTRSDNPRDCLISIKSRCFLGHLLFYGADEDIKGLILLLIRKIGLKCEYMIYDKETFLELKSIIDIGN